jgi:ABC-type nitrate/sulfonate/bicarbonate transport system substrate-binding protein
MKKIVIISFSLFCVILSSCVKKSNELVLADSSISWWMAPTIIANRDIDKKGNFYELNGLNVKTFDLQTGLASKNAVLSGSADLGITGTTPIAGSVCSGEKLVILCSFVSSDFLLALLTTKELSDTSHFSKPQSPVGIVAGTISELYLRNYLHQHFATDDYNQINKLSMKPADIPNAIINGNVKSVVIWEPFVTKIAENNPNFKINRDSSIYSHRMYLITRQDILQEKRSLIIKFIKSLKEASDYIKGNKSKSQELVLRNLADQQVSMENLWSKVDFSIKFDYNNMKSLIKKDISFLTLVNGNNHKIEDKELDQLFDFKLEEQINGTKR